MSQETRAVAAVSAASMTAFGETPQNSGDRSTERSPSGQKAPDYRLVIEEGPRPGAFVYKTIDRVTGETIRQFPREELVKLGETPGYSAGQVASTRA